MALKREYMLCFHGVKPFTFSDENIRVAILALGSSKKCYSKTRKTLGFKIGSMRNM